MPRENAFPRRVKLRVLSECQRSTIRLDFCPEHLNYVKAGTSIESRLSHSPRDNRCILLSYVSARQYRRYDVPLPLISLLAVVARFANRTASLLSDGTSKTIVHSRGKECGNLPVLYRRLRPPENLVCRRCSLVNTVCLL